MADGKLVGFTDNYNDDSTEAGFQFTFFCDICREGYKTGFTESKTHKKGSLLRGIGKAASAAAWMTTRSSAGYGVERGLDAVSDRFEEKSPAWRKEYEKAFEGAQNEAKGYFHRCPKCTRWVCENDFNEQDGLCTECAPRIGVEIAAARAEKISTEIKGKAAQTQLFTGEIQSKQTICPQCDKPAGDGKFCANCGLSLALAECSRCGAKSSAGTRFCGECGTRIE